MDHLSFLSTLIGHIAWPVTSFLIVLLLRGPITSIFDSVKPKLVKVKDFEMHFTEDLQSIQKDVHGHKGGSTWQVTSTKDLKPNMKALAELSPLGVVLQAWDNLESTVTDCATEKSGNSFTNGGMALDWLENNGLLKDKFMNYYYRLKALRERFSNFENEELPKERALEYADLVLSISRKIRETSKS